MGAATSCNISGKYKHFKGNTYDVYCVAVDSHGKRFVLYQQLYGSKDFWIRPYDMFFDEVECDGTKIKRFTPTSPKRQPAEKKIHQLIEIIQEKRIVVKDSENEQTYCITNISQDREFIYVHPLADVQRSGYLTDYELAARMGHDICIINEKAQIKKLSIAENQKLCIGHNDRSVIENQLNPCSIDLQIAGSGFLLTKRRLVDPQSVEHVSKATELWKKVKTYKSKDQSSSYFKLRPNQTVLTHTKEKIKIPVDCAGKIEIKSTYARLSLSITSGDFCNPGYEGYFPLEITNRGKHTIIIHANETMAQLILIALHGPRLMDYSKIATQKNEKGYDDGTPYTFWRERSLKSMRGNAGTQQLVDLYHRVLENINSDNARDVNGEKERFSDNYLTFCQRNMYKKKFRSADKELPDIKKLFYAYINHEKMMKKFFSAKWLAPVGALLCAIIPTIIQLVAEDTIHCSSLWPSWLIAFVMAILAVIWFVKSPKVFCTFEQYDIAADLQSIAPSE